MPRTARASAGNLIYHVLNRGNGRATVFHCDGDYAAFLRLIGDACGRVPMRILAACLMPNHFHLVLWPLADGDLSRWMGWRLSETRPPGDEPAITPASPDRRGRPRQPRPAGRRRRRRGGS